MAQARRELYGESPALGATMLVGDGLPIFGAWAHLIMGEI
jgi:hypothetical protein